MAIAVMCLHYCGLLLSEEFLFIIVKLSFTSHAAILNYHRSLHFVFLIPVFGHDFFLF